MNYFPFHLGDYAAHTGHLEPMEDLAYRRLLDQYYLREGPLPADIQVTAKLVRMRSMAADVESVLNEFFVLTDKGWMHERCETEIAHMRDKQAKARASAAASVKSRQAFAAKKSQAGETSVGDSPNGRSADAEKISTDVQLPTPTPTPTPTPDKENSSPDGEDQKKPRDELADPPRQLDLTGVPGAEPAAGEGSGEPTPPAPADADPPGDDEPADDDPIPVSAVKRPKGVTAQTWADWLALRKKKYAPPSQTVLEMAVKEAEKAGLSLEDFFRIWCLRGTQGLKSEWLTPEERRSVARPALPVETFRERDERLSRQKWEEMTGRRQAGGAIDIAQPALRLAK
jgi:uncharacterized protein YdaU (DUF1376 family)